ncbi:MAG TPA: hypothetical protein PLV68_21460, partial [Ilumatobacteraceae bacterium]|nr:hypothetical protein [Ilumatobacteraceae bacterium]
AVTVDEAGGTVVDLTVTVAAASLGLTGDATVPLAVRIDDGVLSRVTYSTTTSDGRTAVATTVIGPVVDGSPVVAPA